MELNPSKTVSPLIVIDPVDKTRNITASLSMENFSKFKGIAGDYLKAGSEKFFEKKDIIPGDSFKIRINPLGGKKDVVGSKIVKVMNYIKINLDNDGFKVMNSGWFWIRDAVFWFKVKNKNLPKEVIHKGPPINLPKYVSQFKKKYKKVFVKGNFLYAKIKRKETSAKMFIDRLLKEKYVKGTKQKLI